MSKNIYYTLAAIGAIAGIKHKTRSNKIGGFNITSVRKMMDIDGVGKNLTGLSISAEEGRWGQDARRVPQYLRYIFENFNQFSNLSTLDINFGRNNSWAYGEDPNLKKQVEQSFVKNFTMNMPNPYGKDYPPLCRHLVSMSLSGLSFDKVEELQFYQKDYWANLTDLRIETSLGQRSLYREIDLRGAKNLRNLKMGIGIPIHTIIMAATNKIQTERLGLSPSQSFLKNLIESSGKSVVNLSGNRNVESLEIRLVQDKPNYIYNIWYGRENSLSDFSNMMQDFSMEWCRNMTQEEQTGIVCSLFGEVIDLHDSTLQGIISIMDSFSLAPKGSYTKDLLYKSKRLNDNSDRKYNAIRLSENLGDFARHFAIGRLPEHVSRLKNLRHLKLKSVIPSKSIEKLSKLETIELENVGIIPASVFNSNARTIDINSLLCLNSINIRKPNNKLKELSVETWKMDMRFLNKMVALEKLTVKTDKYIRNALARAAHTLLPDIPFPTSLEKLNKLKEVEIFIGVRYPYAVKNKVEAMIASVLTLKSLKKLKLRAYPSERRSDLILDLRHMKDLTSLKLETSIPCANIKINGLKKLKTVTIKGYGENIDLQKLNLDGLDSLETLIIEVRQEGNTIGNLPSFEGLRNIKRIKIESNIMIENGSVFGTGLGDMKKLRTLEIDGIGIQDSSYFNNPELNPVKMDNLTKVVLKNIRCESKIEFPRWICQAKNLETLLINKGIRNIPNCLGNLKKLDGLKIPKTILRRIEDRPSNTSIIQWIVSGFNREIAIRIMKEIKPPEERNIRGF